ncbi:MAG: aldehyde dehydrogenase family protein [Phycisphaeraceae bacterium]|nr:aldehyde dehydrogenase family protein [Phycisphaeraceae bacterium]
MSESRSSQSDSKARGWSLSDRLAWVAAFRRTLATRQDELIELIARDVEKPSFEALMGDVLPLLSACKWVENRAGSLLSLRRLRHGGVFLLANKATLTRAPLGHVAIIATWNYPVQLLGIELLQALVAGNRVTVKPSENSPRSQIFLLELAREAGRGANMPPDQLAWTAPTREAGATLLKDNRFDHVVFTGSTNVGVAIAETLAPSMTSSTLELSGRDSAFVLDDADPELAASAIWQGIDMNSGQTCMAPRRALVDEKVYAEFVRRIASRAGAARPRPLINEHAAKQCYDLAVECQRLGGRSLAGVIEPPSADANGRLRCLRPMVFADCPRDVPLVEGRHFGPLLAVIPVKDLEDALACHDRIDQVLATSVFTRNPARVEDFRDRLRSTLVTVNDCLLPTIHPSVGLAGHGKSGWGITKGEAGLLAMTRPIYTTQTAPLFRFSMEAVTPAIERGMSRFIRFWYGGSKPAPKTPTTVSAPETQSRQPDQSVATSAAN